MPKVPKPGDTGTVLHACQEHVVVRMDDGTLVTCEHMREGVPMDADGYIANFEPAGRSRVRVTSMEPLRGPGKASTPKYRAGWDRVFGRVNTRTSQSQAN